MSARPLTLRLDDLQPHDRKAIDVFLRYASNGEDKRWKAVVDDRDQPADLTFRHASGGQEALTAGDKVVWVLDAGAAAPEGTFCLTRPLQLESFTSLLDKAARQAADPEAVTPASYPDMDLHSVGQPQSHSFPVTRLRSNANDLPPSEPRSGAPALPPPTKESKPLPAVAWTGGRARLNRWPSLDVLRTDPKGAVMASFLTREALDPMQLAILSGLSRDRCLAFMGQLNAAGLLARSPALHRTGGRSHAPSGEPVAREPIAAATAGLKGMAGLVAKLRARFGYQ